MPLLFSVRRSAVVPYSARQMYDLVLDVPAYPEFLPGCVAARTLSITETSQVASMTLSKGPLKKTFTTRNALEADRIDMQLLDGPFKHLAGVWRFESLPDNTTRVSLTLDFEFKNRIASMTLGPIFRLLTESFLDAFVKRAESVYGLVRESRDDE